MPNKNKRQNGKSFMAGTPPAVWVQEHPQNMLPIVHQENNLDFYQEGRSEPKPPPSSIISNMKHVPARPPLKDNTTVPDTVASGKAVRSVATKPPPSWYNVPKPNPESKEIYKSNYSWTPVNSPSSTLAKSAVKSTAGACKNEEKEPTERSSHNDNHYDDYSREANNDEDYYHYYDEKSRASNLHQSEQQQKKIDSAADKRIEDDDDTDAFAIYNKVYRK